MTTVFCSNSLSSHKVGMALACEDVAVAHHNGTMSYVVPSCLYACNLNTVEVEAEESRVQGHNGLKASLGYMNSRKAMTRNGFSPKTSFGKALRLAPHSDQWSPGSQLLC